MAHIPKELMRDWKDEEVMRADDYKRERDIIVAAHNDTDAKIAGFPGTEAILQWIAENENGDHKGTWQGYTPSDLNQTLEVTPEGIGAARKEDLEALSETIGRMKANRVDLNDYDRLEDEEDDRGRFQRAIDDTLEGGELRVPDGYYYADSLVIDKPMTITFEGNATIEAVEENKDILTIQGTAEETTYSLSSNVQRGQRVITLSATPTGYEEGDMIVLTDDTVRAGDGQIDVNSEVHEIAMIVGNQITLRDPVRLPKIVSTVNVYKVNPVDNVKIYNFSYVAKEGSTAGRGLFLQYVRNTHIRGFRSYQGAGSAIQVQKALYTTIENFNIQKPQVTGSGQGYGVQFYGGCNGVLIRNGFTLDCRHSVDLEGTYDAYVSNVLDYNSRGAAFVMSHNGWASDITFHSCQTINTAGNGFVADSQGFTDPLLCTFYNFNVINCKVITQSSGTAGVYFYSPCKNSIVRDCKIRYLSGAEGGYTSLTNTGIRCYPARTELLISGCDISGFRRGISLQTAGTIVYENDNSKITIRDTTIKNCDAAILMNNGQKRRVRIYNLDCDNILAKVFEISGTQSQSEFVVDGLSLTNSDNAFFFTGTFMSPSGDQCRGYIANIRTDRPNNYAPAANWNLTDSPLYLYGDGHSVLLTGSNTTSGTSPLPNGLVEGQILTIVTMSGTWTINKGSNMVFLNGASSVTLNAQRRTLTMIWRNGIWLEIN